MNAVSLTAGVNSSFPTTNGWTGIVNNSSGETGSFLVAVACANRPPHYSVVSSKPVNTPSPHRTTVTVSCPKSAKPLGGGSQSNGSTSVYLGASRPFQNGWRITEENSTATLATRVIEPGPTVKAFVVCGTVPGYRLLTGKARAVLPLSQAMLTANCPSGSVIIGGGAGVNTSNLGVNLNMTGPIDPTAEAVLNGPRPPFGWNTIVNNNNEVAATASPFAICAGG